MTRSKFGTRRRAVLLAGLAAASASLLLTGCGSGQTSSTADTVAAIDGVDAQVAAPNGAGSYKVRNLTAEFKLEGYPAGSDARLSVALFNETGGPVTVQVSSPEAEAVRLVGPAPTGAGTPTGPAPTATGAAPGSETPAPGGSASATPSAAPAPAEPVGQPASITVPPAGFVLLNEQQASYLLLTGLKRDLTEGDTIPVVFDFGGQQLTVETGLAVPLSPLPRGPRVVDEGDEGDVAPEQS